MKKRTWILELWKSLIIGDSIPGGKEQTTQVNYLKLIRKNKNTLPNEWKFSTGLVITQTSKIYNQKQKWKKTKTFWVLLFKKDSDKLPIGKSSLGKKGKIWKRASKHNKTRQLEIIYICYFLYI